MAAGEVGKALGIKRELSVEDLFVPLNRLDVRHPSPSTSAADAKPRVSVSDYVRPTADPGPNPRPRVSVFEIPLPAQPQSVTQTDAAFIADCDHRLRNSNSPRARLSSSFSLDMAPIPEEIGLGFAEKSAGHVLAMDFNTEESGLGLGFALTKEQMRNKGLPTASASLQTQGNSSSDDEQPVVDNRKQRRMLSNRESARRSRLRKQQHLDELRGHVAQLRAQNSQMLNSFNLASQQFAQITEENRQLRSEAMDLSHKLQRLHHTVTSQRANNGLRYAMDCRKEVQAPQY